MYTELAYGVVHENSEVFYCHSHIPIGPTSLIWPVLVTLVLRGRDHYSINEIPKRELFFCNIFKIFPFKALNDSNGTAHMLQFHSQSVQISVSERSETTQYETLLSDYDTDLEDLITHYVAIDFDPSHADLNLRQCSSY